MKFRIYRLKAIATADGGDLQVKRGVLGMPTVVQESFRCFMFCANLHEVRSGIETVGFSEVCTQAALSFVNV